MPRRQPRPGAVQTAHGFVQVFIASCSSDDHILPKNGQFPCALWRHGCKLSVLLLFAHCFPRLQLSGLACACPLTGRGGICAGKFSPFHGFSRMLSHHAHIKDGGTSDMWGDLRQEFVNVEAAIRQGDPAAMNKALTTLGEIIEAGSEAEHVWEEMYEAIEAKTKVSEREWRRLRDLRQFMTVQQSMDLVSYLVECVTRHVTDRDTLARITVDMDKVLSSRSDG